MHPAWTALLHERPFQPSAFVRSVARPGRYCDGNGLYLHIEPSGARLRAQRLVIHDKSRALGIGGSALAPLAEAREHALANRRLARVTGHEPCRSTTGRRSRKRIICVDIATNMFITSSCDRTEEDKERRKPGAQSGRA